MISRHSNSGAEALWMSSHSTVIAVALLTLPLTRSVFWGPMAISIMGGLIVATALTLVFVPAMYAAWFKVGRQEATHKAGVAT